jgi:hypothetical protein
MASECVSVFGGYCVVLRTGAELLRLKDAHDDDHENLSSSRSLANMAESAMELQWRL